MLAPRVHQVVRARVEAELVGERQARLGWERRGGGHGRAPRTVGMDICPENVAPGGSFRADQRQAQAATRVEGCRSGPRRVARGSRRVCLMAKAASRHCQSRWFGFVRRSCSPRSRRRASRLRRATWTFGSGAVRRGAGGAEHLPVAGRAGTSASPGRDVRGPVRAAPSARRAGPATGRAGG